ncbi:MAG: ROK family protein [Caldilineales bacterium]|nr:ROK family protein [Caldilineales bacterium]
MTTPAFVAGVDLGGTKILAAIVDETGAIRSRNKMPSVSAKSDQRPGPELIADRIALAVQEAAAAAGLGLADLAAVGASAPGPVNVHSGEVLGAVNLPGWEKPFPLGPELSTRLHGLPVAVDNDVNLGVWGEVMYGAGRGLRDVVGIFIGTGIGGGVVLGGELRHGVRWSAGEIGHMSMHCRGMQADVEAFASRGAISRQMHKALAKRKTRILARIVGEREKAGKGAGITSSVIKQALAAGDPTTVQAVAQSQQIVALLIASIVNLLDPECVILGGGLVESLGDLYVAPVRRQAYAHFFLQQDVERVQIVTAALGDDAVVLGAAALARARFGKATQPG